MKVLVTGADGFVGRYLVRHVLAAGHSVRAGARPGAAPASEWFTPVEQRAIEWVPLELLDADSVRAAVGGGLDAIVHLAAIASGAEAMRDPAAAWTVNAVGTARLAEAAGMARDGGAADPRLLVVSSGEVYGAADHPLTESDPPRPQSPYAASKVGAEVAALEVGRRTGLCVMVARPFTHTGPGQLDVYLIPALIRRLAEARRDGLASVPVGNLSPVRDFTDVRDVVAAYLLLLERGSPGTTYNVSRGEGTALTELFARIARIVGTDAAARPDPALMRRADLPFLVGDSTRLRQATGWAPAVSLDQTLQDMLDAQAH